MQFRNLIYNYLERERRSCNHKNVTFTQCKIEFTLDFLSTYYYFDDDKLLVCGIIVFRTTQRHAEVIEAKHKIQTRQECIERTINN